ncbi:MAG: hypothetical protein P4M12_11610 [Gammaproteobacteria bacterium]|nr:hypothetical protein [Gammaproteobacteria bacterium]
MIKKLLITTAALSLISNVAFAAQTTHHHVKHATHKHATHKVDLKQEQVVEAPVVVPVVTSSGVAYVGAGLGVNMVSSYKGLIGNLFAGYGKLLDDNQKFYLGGEVLADAGSIPLSGKSYGNRATYGLGASIIPGYMLTKDTMAYGRVGVKALHYTGTNSTHTGGQLGLGVQTNVAQNWDVRGEYSYTGYGIFKNFTQHGSNQVNLGLVYKLN